MAEEKQQRYVKEVWFPASWPRSEICMAVDKAVDEILAKGELLFDEEG